MKFSLLTFVLIIYNITPALSQPILDPLRKLQNSAISYSKVGIKDEFSEPPKAGDSLGKEFRFIIPLETVHSTRAVNYLSTGRYEFVNGSLVTYLDHWYGALPAYERANIITHPSYIGSTAFGRSMNIRVETIQKVGVSILNVSDPSLRGQDTSRFNSFEYKSSMSGNVARRLSTSLRYEIFGTISMFKNGQSVECKSGTSVPKIDLPIKFTYHFCTIAVEATRIILRDGANGPVVKSWEGSEITNLKKTDD